MNSFQSNKEAISSYPQAKVYTIAGDTKHILVKDLVPFSIGELAICFLQMPGPSSDNACISVTHVTADSTKLPVLFTGDLLGVW